MRFLSNRPKTSTAILDGPQKESFVEVEAADRLTHLPEAHTHLGRLTSLPPHRRQGHRRTPLPEVQQAGLIGQLKRRLTIPIGVPVQEEPMGHCMCTTTQLASTPPWPTTPLCTGKCTTTGMGTTSITVHTATTKTHPTIPGTVALPWA